MATRVVEGKKPYTGGDAIDINQNKVISLKLRDENNLIIYDSGDDEIYVDLQLADGIEPTDAFPVGVTTGRVLVADEWDKTGTLICAKTTSGDNIKLLYADDGTLWIDNGTGTFKQIYLSTDIATILTDYATKEYVDAHDTIISSTEPEDPYEGMIWYNTGTDKLKVYNGASWQDIGSGGGGSSYTAGYGIDIDANDEISVDTSEIATQSDLSSKQDELVSGTNIKTINNESLLGSGDITISGGGAEIEYKTQAEYDALPSSKLTDGKHYVIYTADTPTPPTPGGWQPGANTIGYRPLENDCNDYSGNGYDGTWGSPSYTTSGTTIDVAYFNGSYISLPTFTITENVTTINVWAKVTSSNSWQELFDANDGDGITTSVTYFGYNGPGNVSDQYGMQHAMPQGNYAVAYSDDGPYIDQWVNICVLMDTSGVEMYVNGVLQSTTSNLSGAMIGTPNASIGGRKYGNTNFFHGYLSQFIWEDKKRTATEIEDYFNQTKANYGIS